MKKTRTWRIKTERMTCYEWPNQSRIYKWPRNSRESSDARGMNQLKDWIHWSFQNNHGTLKNYAQISLALTISTLGATRESFQFMGTINIWSWNSKTAFPSNQEAPYICNIRWAENFCFYLDDDDNPNFPLLEFESVGIFQAYPPTVNLNTPRQLSII